MPLLGNIHPGREMERKIAAGNHSQEKHRYYDNYRCHDYKDHCSEEFVLKKAGL